MSRWDEWGWYPKPAPKRPPPERGIKVKKIGATWWGQRWIEALEKLSWEYASRLARGRTYARAGRVHDLEVAPGKVTARVTGSRPTPYKVTLRLAVLEDVVGDDEDAVDDSDDGLLIAAPLDEAAVQGREVGVAFPYGTAGTLDQGLAQGAVGVPSPATQPQLGEAFDKDPFLLFELRGRGGNAVLGALRKLRAGAGGTAAAASEARAEEPIRAVALTGKDPADFERLSGPVDQLHFFRIEPPASPAAVLRQLGAPPSWCLDETPAEVLGALSAAASALARELALRPSDEAAPRPAGVRPTRG